MEGGRVGQTVRNTNATYDIGPMQINSSWLGKVAKLGITRDQVLNNACINIGVAAWIFVQEWQRSPNNVGLAMARYHSPTARHQHRYLGLVNAAITRRVGKLERLASTPVIGGGGGNLLGQASQR